MVLTLSLHSKLEVRRELKELRRPYGTLSETLKEGLSHAEAQPSANGGRDA